MDQRTAKITEGLKKAIEAEVDGYHFYMMAAGSTQDPRGREVFQRLAQDELEHVRFLRAQVDSFAEHGRPDAMVRLGARAPLEGASPIFSDQIRQRLGEAHFEMSALSIGIQLEVTAEGFYRARAAEADEEGARRFYLELADWESEHYQALLRQQESLKEDYWAAGGFSPF